MERPPECRLCFPKQNPIKFPSTHELSVDDLLPWNLSPSMLKLNKESLGKNLWKKKRIQKSSLIKLDLMGRQFFQFWAKNKVQSSWVKGSENSRKIDWDLWAFLTLLILINVSKGEALRVFFMRVASYVPMETTFSHFITAKTYPT